MSWLPRGRTSRTRHSMLIGASTMSGALTLAAGPGVNPISSNFLYFLPERTPHQSVAAASGTVVRLMTNSPVRLRMACEWRSGRTEM